MSNALVPELLVASLPASLAFWTGLLGFTVRYARPEEGFAFLALEGAEVMLEEQGRGRNWLTAPLERPLGRGLNFQITLADIEPPLTRLQRAGHPLFMPPETKWYRAGSLETGQRQFLVQDPDGYLLRLCQALGTRPAAPLP